MSNLMKRYSEPTPKYWRQMGDFALVMLVAIEGFIPRMPLEADVKEWLSIGVALLLVGFKFWTNTKSIHSK